VVAGADIKEFSAQFPIVFMSIVQLKSKLLEKIPVQPGKKDPALGNVIPGVFLFQLNFLSAIQGLIQYFDLLEDYDKIIK